MKAHATSAGWRGHRDRLFPEYDVYFYPGGRYGSRITMVLSMLVLLFGAGVAVAAFVQAVR